MDFVLKFLPAPVAKMLDDSRFFFVFFTLSILFFISGTIVFIFLEIASDVIPFIPLAPLAVVAAVWSLMGIMVSSILSRMTNTPSCSKPETTTPVDIQTSKPVHTESIVEEMRYNEISNKDLGKSSNSDPETIKKEEQEQHVDAPKTI